MIFGKFIYKNVFVVICFYLFIGFMFRFYINSMIKLCKMVYIIVGLYFSVIVFSVLVGFCFFVGFRYSFFVGFFIFLMFYYNICLFEEVEKYFVLVLD